MRPSELTDVEVGCHFDIREAVIAGNSADAPEWFVWVHRQTGFNVNGVRCTNSNSNGSKDSKDNEDDGNKGGRNMRPRVL